MTIPDRETCYRLFKHTEMLDNIVRHSIQVCRVALLLTDALPENRNGMDRNLVRAAALLHDITKTRSLETGERHADTGGEYLTGLGYPAVADIVRQHVRLDRYEETLPVTEVEIVNYADKRVLHDRITPLEERMRYIMERYGTDPDVRDRIVVVWEKTRLLERKIFFETGITPEDVSQNLPDPACDLEFAAFRQSRH